MASIVSRYNILDMVDLVLIEKIKEFIEQEGKSCSMDFGCITPLYVYRMWGGQVSLKEIEVGLNEIKRILL